MPDYPISHELDDTRTYIIKGIDTSVIAASFLFATEQGSRQFFPQIIHFYCPSSAIVLGVATASVGFNASTYNNILAATALTGLVGGLYLPMPLALVAAPIPPNTPVYVNISAAVIGAQFVDVSVLGVYS